MSAGGGGGNMPSRILKESILDSPTLAKLDEFVQDQFPRLLLLVDDWGCPSVTSPSRRLGLFQRGRRVDQRESLPEATEGHRHRHREDSEGFL
jgi:hypothetical protein